MTDQRVDLLERGVWGVVATPFTAEGAVDEASLARLVQFYESVGARGLTVLGVFGEAAMLTTTERRQVLRVVVEHSHLPIVAGVTSLATAPAITEIESAQEITGHRLRAVMVQANSSRSDLVVEHLQCLHEVTGTVVVLQDYPRSSDVSIATSDLIDVVKGCSFICAVKAEAPPTAVAISRITTQVDVAVFGGLGGQGLLDELAAGAAGAMTGFSYPEALVACVSAWHDSAQKSARAELLPYLPLINFEQQPGKALAVRKELFRQRGLFSTGAVRSPTIQLPREDRAFATRHLDDLARETST